MDEVVRFADSNRIGAVLVAHDGSLQIEHYAAGAPEHRFGGHSMTRVDARARRDRKRHPVDRGEIRSLAERTTHSDVQLMLGQADGRAIAYCCIPATPRDWARVGKLLPREGESRGRRIVSTVESLRCVHSRASCAFRIPTVSWPRLAGSGDESPGGRTEGRARAGEYNGF